MNFNYEIKQTDSKEEQVQKLYELFSFRNKQPAEKALEFISEIMKSDIKRKNYRKLFISYFNKNSIIQALNRDVAIKDALEPVDIEKKYLTFPSTIQAEILNMAYGYL